MQLTGDVNFEELARSTDEMNAAQLKAVCVEAGMIALREGASKLSHEHFHSGIAEGRVARHNVRSLKAHRFLISYSAEQEEERSRVLRIELSRLSFSGMHSLLSNGAATALPVQAISQLPFPVPMKFYTPITQAALWY